MQNGKSFPTMRLWSSIEDQLIATIAHIWAERYANPNEDLDTCLRKYLDPLAKRLNIVLGGWPLKFCSLSWFSWEILCFANRHVPPRMIGCGPR